MDLNTEDYVDNIIENPSFLTSLMVGGIVAVASVATRKGAEHSWKKVFDRPPPHKQAYENADIKDAMLWAVLIGATTGLVRLGVRRALRPKAKKLLKD